MSNPFARRPPNKVRKESRRVGPDRVRLGSAEYHELRIEAYTRACGKCECGCDRNAFHSVSRPHPDAGEFAHNEHGSRKSDELSRGRWLNWQCHSRSHNAGGHPCPRRPGKVMNLKEAEEYWRGDKCFCDNAKKARESFCADCLLKVSPQTRHDLENADDPDVYREVLAAAEIEILKQGAA